MLCTTLLVAVVCTVLGTAADLCTFACCGILPGEHIACTLCTFCIRAAAGVTAFNCCRAVYLDLLQVTKLIFIVSASGYAALKLVHNSRFLSDVLFRVCCGQLYFPRNPLLYTTQNTHESLKKRYEYAILNWFSLRSFTAVFDRKGKAVIL
jgi:hypothetical protein